MLTRNIIIQAFLVGIGVLLLGDFVFAQEPSNFARALGVAYPDTRLLVVRLLQIVWFFVMVGAIGFLIYGYVLLRRSDPEDLYEGPRAKRMMLYSGIVAGASLVLVIILTVTYFIIERGYRKESALPQEKEQVAGLGGRFFLSQSKIKDHYPLRDERNVSRDTSILVTFSEKVRKESILDSTNTVRRESILIRRSTPTQSGDYGVVAATGVLSVDGSTLKILPAALLGNPDQKISYTVALTSSIQKQNGEALFTKDEGGYIWQFEVSGLIDTTPPTVESYLPLANSQNPINTLIQVTFSESIDPFVITPDNGVVLSGEAGKQQSVSGYWNIGNGYRTITFFSQTACGTNQCGNPVFCLPARNALSVRLKAAPIAVASAGRSNPNKAQFPYTGIVDMAGNSLDGGGLHAQERNGKSDGTEKDDFILTFFTGTEKETTPPTIISLAPGRDASGVSLTAPVVAIFSEFMDITSLTVSSIGFSREMNIWISNNHSFSEKKTRAQIYHEPFKANEIYTPVIRSGVMDMYQNCYNPCAGPGVGQSLASQ